jgi:hypothetical protein
MFQDSNGVPAAAAAAAALMLRLVFAPRHPAIRITLIRIHFEFHPKPQSNPQILR